MTLPEIAEAVGGTVHDDPGVTVRGAASVDSRAVEPDGLFVAVAGEHVDGHDYAAGAVAGGAAAVLAARPLGVPAVVVADPVAGLAALASHVRDRLQRTRVVALTGSQGKTSTKDLLAQVLADAGRTVATRGNNNNEVGLPITVLRADEDTEFLVLEMVARGIGHIRELCETARPEVALVLNVGKAHVGEFGSQEAIAQAKGEIVEDLPPSGVAVLNADDPLVAAMATRTTAAVRTFGESGSADVRVRDLELDAQGRARFVLEADGSRADVHLQVLGEHQAGNAAAAAAAALALGLPLDAVADSLSRAAATSPGRMEVRERADGVTVLNDAYNANPDSMRAGLKALAALGRSRRDGLGRTVAVLGEMRELGESSREEHDAVGRLAVRLDIGQLLVVGEPARAIHLGACLEGSWGEESVFVPDADAALAWLDEHVRPGDVVLFKASNAAGLQRVAERFAGNEAGTAGATTTGESGDRSAATGPKEDTDR
ncbi:MAG: UDP-N-acetylmuramoyl-tripeptide--D-alanyl-D-alanine ligase [Nocardioides sp.]